jgi:hypothetical protein
VALLRIDGAHSLPVGRSPPACGKRHMVLTGAGLSTDQARLSLRFSARMRRGAMELLENTIVRKLILAGATGLCLAFGAVGAQANAADHPPAIVTVDRQAPKADPSAPLVEGRSAYAEDGDDQALGAIGTIAHQIVLVAAAALILAIGAVGVEALWLRDRWASSPYDGPDRPPYDP